MFFIGRKKALGTKILIMANICTLILLTVLGAIISFSNSKELNKALDKKIEQALFLLSKGTVNYIYNIEYGPLSPLADEVILNDDEIIDIQFLDEFKKQLNKESRLDLPHRNILYFNRPIVHTDSKTTIGQIRIGFTREFIEKTILKNIQLIIVMIIIIQIIMTITLWISIKKGMRPLKKSSHSLYDVTNVLRNSSTSLEKINDSLEDSIMDQTTATHECIAAMEEMSSMIEHSNNYATTSQEVLDVITNNTKKGDYIINNLLTSMGNLSDMFQQLTKMDGMIKGIASKTRIINDIVFKTQLLSFNASIEAARAGQHGKGFSVVAEEVGQLAQVSGQAAQEIHTLIAISSKFVENLISDLQKTFKEGKKTSEEAGEIFGIISSKIYEVNTQISSVTNALNEQRKGIGLTEKAIKQVDRASQRASESAKEAHQQSMSLANISDKAQDISEVITDIVDGR